MQPKAAERKLHLRWAARRNNCNKLRGSPPCCGPGAGGSLGYHTEHSGTPGSCPRCNTGAAGAPRGLCRHLAAPPGTGSGSSASLGCTNLLLFLHGNRDRPAALPSLVWDAQTCCARENQELQSFLGFWGKLLLCSWVPLGPPCLNVIPVSWRSLLHTGGNPETINRFSVLFFMCVWIRKEP